MSFILLGCAGKKTMSLEVKRGLTKIVLDKNVNMPKEIMFMTKGDALTIGLGGIIGGVISASDMTQEERLQKFLDDNNISFDEILKEEYLLALKSRPYYANRLTTDSNAQNRFKLTVNMYGLMYHHNIFSSDYKPSANIKFELLDKNNEVIWSETDFASSYTEETSRMPLEDYFKNPRNMREAFHSVARVISRLVVAKLP